MKNRFPFTLSWFKGLTLAPVVGNIESQYISFSSKRYRQNHNNQNVGTSILLTDQDNDRIIRICCFFFIRNLFLIHACVKLTGAQSSDPTLMPLPSTNSPFFCCKTNIWLGFSRNVAHFQRGMVFRGGEAAHQMVEFFF